jgi:DnaJ-class molecular chaperone
VTDPYATLGVPRDAPDADIRKAYKKLAKTHHPDLNPGDKGAEDRFKAISAAYSLLSDAEKRAQFDRGEIDASGQPQPSWTPYREHAEGQAGRRYRARPSDHSGDSDDLGDLFRSMFGGRGDGADIRMRGQDEVYALAVPFLEAVNGATRRLSLPDGRTLDVTIPAGTEDGQMLRLRGQGGAGWNDGPRGDALIQVRVEPHRYFSRDGRDVRLELPVTIAEAALGGPVEAPTPGGKVRLKIPPGSDSGTELRLRGRGVPAHQGQPAGDLYVVLRVTIGKPDAELEAFLREWKPQIDPRAELESRA